MEGEREGWREKENKEKKKIRIERESKELPVR